MELLVKSIDEDGEYFKLTFQVFPNLSISDEKSPFYKSYKPIDRRTFECIVQ